MTPLKLKVILHCHTDPLPHPRLDAPAVREAIEEFLAAGLIERANGPNEIYRTTERGNAWITMLLVTPYPKRAWIDAQNHVICVEGHK